MIELLDGFFVNPHAVTVVKAIDEKSCALWVRGQSATDGFVLQYSASEVAEAVTDACEEVEYDEDEAEQEEA